MREHHWNHLHLSSKPESYGQTGAMADGMRRDSLADDAYSLSTTRDDEEERLVAPDESTSLLGTGAASSYAGSEDDNPPPGKDSWDGYEEFAGLPWHKRPSVCLPDGRTEF